MDRELLQRNRAALGRRASLTVAAVSHYLAAAAASSPEVKAAAGDDAAVRFRADRGALLAAMLPLLRRACNRLVDDALAALRREGWLGDAPPPATFREPRYQERVVLLALERCLVNAAAPPLLVSPQPEPTLQDLLSTRPAVAVVFDQPLAITHEFYPLVTDHFVSSLERAPDHPPLPALVGVQSEWLTSTGDATRAIAFDAQLDVFVEAPCRQAVRPAAALFLAVSGSAHARLGQQLEDAGVTCLNPHRVAALADDKWACFQRWQAAGVATPPTALLARDATAAQVRTAVAAFVAACPPWPGPTGSWLVQPRHGTEGQGVIVVDAGTGVETRVARAWEQTRAGDDAILRPRVGSAQLRLDGGPAAFDLRLHVVHDGNNGQAESGYLLVAPPGQIITSVGRGGHTLPVGTLRDQGVADVDGAAAPWEQAALDAACTLACSASTALGPLWLCGCDIKFDCRDHRLVPSILDLNPRPAGLLYAGLLAGDEAGVSTRLWPAVGRQVHGCRGALAP
jgi:hypothetical protein